MSESESKAAAEAVDATPSVRFQGSKAPAHNIHDVMNFDQLIQKVQQAEDALEANERRMAANWRQLKASWRAGWTPGRIIVAGLGGGYLAGRLDPAKLLAKGGGLVQIFSMLSGLIASSSAQAAAGQAEKAATSAEEVVDTVAADATTPPAARAGVRNAGRVP